jgi:hypothetical protein
MRNGIPTCAAVALVLTACSEPTGSEQKLFAEERKALEKAQGVEDTLMDAHQQQREQIDLQTR